MRETPMWGITPVPERLRVLGGVDTTLLWTNLGISLLVLVLPAYFDLSLKKALLATLVGGAIGNGMLALRRAQGLVLARRRHRRRGDRLLGAARRGLHALLARPPHRVLRRRHRLLPADALPVRVRLDPRPVARRRPESPRADPRDDRRRRRGGGAGTARADGGRD